MSMYNPPINIQDLVIPGIEPLSIGRVYHYDPLQMGATNQDGGQSWDLDFAESVSRSKLDEEGEALFASC